jgi:phage FluMu gp28-like protein
VRLRTAKAAFLEFVDLEAASGIPGAKWEPFQVRYLNNETRWAIDVKSRQIAWSFTAALDAVIDGILTPDTAHIFVSINQDEAREKVRYARAIIEAIDPPVRPRLVRDSQAELEFANGSRLISHPCRPPRGKPRARIYLDEMAHYPEGMDREIYRAALPATVKGDGYIRIGSSPLGARGLFWEIVTESLRRYPGYDGHRRYIPWWQVRALCKDVKAAASVAPAMPTAERVYQLGTPALVDIFENMFLEDFQQEYECAWVDEATAWISWELIQANQSPGHLWWHAKSTSEALALVPQILEAIKARRCEAALAGGIDVGRQRDLTEFMVVGKGTTAQLPLRLSVSLDRVPFDQQQACFEALIRQLPFTQVLVDQNGLGMQLAEALAKTGKAKGVDFTNASKEVWAVEARIQFERGNAPIPLDRDLAYQIHSIKKTVTAAKNNVFDTEGNEKHHADKFWALALAYSAAGISRASWKAQSYQG